MIYLIQYLDDNNWIDVETCYSASEARLRKVELEANNPNLFYNILVRGY